MKIVTFEISEDRTYINLSITGILNPLTNLKVWTQNTFRDYNKAINLDSKLLGGTSENITITPNDLSLTYFDGIYFVEAWNDNEVDSNFTADLTRYKECILTKILEITTINKCLKISDPSLINAQTLLLSLETAIEESFVDEMMLIVKILDRFCTNTCKSCGSYADIINPDYYKT